MRISDWSSDVCSSDLSQLNWSTGTASSTLTLGDAADADRHLAATAITTAGVAVPDDQSASGAVFETSDASAAATNNCQLVSTVAGAAIGASQVITLRVAYVLDRSEEHTSELQSLMRISYAVFCLKKKKLII